MKTYKVKNYKGNLVESLKKFSESHKGMKIVEACEDGNDLKIKVEESNALNIKNAKKIGIIELNLKTGQAEWIANDNRDIIRVPKSKLGDAVDDDLGAVGFVSGALNTKEALAAAEYIVASLTNKNKEHLKLGVVSADKAYAIIPYTGRAFAEWIGSMAKNVANEYLNGD